MPDVDGEILNQRELDARFTPFQSFDHWKASTVDTGRWERYLTALAAGPRGIVDCFFFTFD